MTAVERTPGVPSVKDGSSSGGALKFGVMLCLYKNNDAAEVSEALRSGVLEQTVRPSELLVVFDGPVPESVAKVVDVFEEYIPTKRIVFAENRGHGEARAAAINACTCPWIGIIDSDDVSLPQRFELLSKAVAAHPDAAVIGGALTEFSDKDGTRKFGAVRQFPETPEEIKQFIRTRSPFAQPTAILRVDAVKSVGNYQTWFNNEDYHLWLRLLARGYELRNLRDVVLLFRTNPALFKRRGGLRYWWNEVRLQWFSLRLGTTSFRSFVVGAAGRFVVQVALPNAARKQFYRVFLRRS